MAESQRRVYTKRDVPKTARFSTRITPETRRKLEEIADFKRESMAEMFERIVDEAYESLFGNVPVETRQQLSHEQVA